MSLQHVTDHKKQKRMKISCKENYHKSGIIRKSVRAKNALEALPTTKAGNTQVPFQITQYSNSVKSKGRSAHDP
jgi:hypothetical protein